MAEEYDMNILKDILKRKDMQMLIDSADQTTECYLRPLSKNKDITSFDSNNTQYVLNKKPLNLEKFLEEIGAKLHYISTGATGHMFRGSIFKDGEIIYSFALKVSAYPKNANYGKITNILRPENAEIAMHRVLSYFVNTKQTPHIILPIATFYTNIKLFVQLSEHGMIEQNTKNYDKFVKRYHEGKYENIVSILLSEWANHGDFLEFVRTRYKNFQLLHWKIFFFQVLSVLAVIQSKYPSFRHNDLKANNILVDKVKQGKPLQYRICGKTYHIRDIGYKLKLCDFDFACIKGVIENIKTSEEWTKQFNITSEPNRYYDVHYFFNTLLRFLPAIINDEKHIPDEVRAFIFRVVPEKYQKGVCVSEKGRILINDEYTTPQKLLENDEFFSVFRVPK